MDTLLSGRIGNRLSRALGKPRDSRSGLKPVLDYKPNHLSVYLTRNCNMRCNHCLWLLQDPNYFSKELDVSLEDLREILEIVQSHVNEVDLVADGEPLMHGQFAEIVHMAKGMGFKHISTVTNGVKINEYVDVILSGLNHIAISIDGPDPVAFKEMRGVPEKVFRKILSNVSNLVTERRKHPESVTEAINITSVVAKFNMGNITDMIELAEELEVDRIRFNNFNPHGTDGDWNPLYRTDPEVQAFFRDIISRDDFKVKISLPPLQDPVAMGKCGILFSTVTVNSEGSLGPCCQIAPDPKWGNIKAEPEAWNSDALVDFRRRYLAAESKMDLPQVCQECHRRAGGAVGRIQFDPKDRIWTRTDILD